MGKEKNMQEQQSDDGNKLFEKYPLPWHITNSAYLQGSWTDYSTVVTKDGNIVFADNKNHHENLQALVDFLNNLAISQWKDQCNQN